MRQVIERNPLRFTFGLQLFLVGLLRTNLIPSPFLRSYAEPQWLYSWLQCIAGLGLLLTLSHRLTWYGRVAIIFAVIVSGMVAEALWQLGSTGAVIYIVMVAMLLTRLAYHD